VRLTSLLFEPFLFICVRLGELNASTLRGLLGLLEMPNPRGMVASSLALPSLALPLSDTRLPL
jgi:hypothetical protein